MPCSLIWGASMRAMQPGYWNPTQNSLFQDRFVNSSLYRILAETKRAKTKIISL